MTEQENNIVKNRSVKFSKLPGGIYVVIQRPGENRTTAIIEKIGDDSIVQISFSSFMRRYFVPGNILEIDNNGGFNTIIRA